MTEYKAKERAMSDHKGRGEKDLEEIFGGREIKGGFNPPPKDVRPKIVPTAQHPVSPSSQNKPKK